MTSGSTHFGDKNSLCVRYERAYTPVPVVTLLGASRGLWCYSQSNGLRCDSRQGKKK